MMNEFEDAPHLDFVELKGGDDDVDIGMYSTN